MPLSGRDITELVHEHLCEHASVSGAVLGVGPAVVRPGRFYLMGFNPGGDPTKHSGRIGDPIVNREDGWCIHTHDCWRCDERPTCKHTDARGVVLPEHRERHQRNVLAAYDALGVQPGSIVATNAVFARSRDTKTLAGTGGLWPWDWWRRCWPVHQALLREVRPEWIVTLGNGGGTTAFGFLMDEAKVKHPDAHRLGDSTARAFKGELPLGDGFGTLSVRILGLPHPSRHDMNELLHDVIRRETSPS